MPYPIKAKLGRKSIALLSALHLNRRRSELSVCGFLRHPNYLPSSGWIYFGGGGVVGVLTKIWQWNVEWHDWTSRKLGCSPVESFHVDHQQRWHPWLYLFHYINAYLLLWCNSVTCKTTFSTFTAIMCVIIYMWPTTELISFYVIVDLQINDTI
jgi:hypothetical protein